MAGAIPYKNRFSHAVKEALSAFLTRDLQEQVIASALRNIGHVEVPDAGESLQNFVAALKSALERKVSYDVASAVIAELTPLFLLAAPEEDTFVRRRALADANRTHEHTSQELRAFFSTRPPPVSNLAAVVLASTHKEKIHAIQNRVGRNRRVLIATDLFALLDCVDAGPILLIVDCNHPSIHFTTLTTLAADLPAGSSVILWGKPQDETILSGWSQVARQWIRCSAEVEAEDIAALCQLILD